MRTAERHLPAAALRAGRSVVPPTPSRSFRRARSWRRDRLPFRVAAPRGAGRDRSSRGGTAARRAGPRFAQARSHLSRTWVPRETLSSARVPRGADDETSRTGSGPPSPAPFAAASSPTPRSRGRLTYTQAIVRNNARSRAPIFRVPVFTTPYFGGARGQVTAIALPSLSFRAEILFPRASRSLPASNLGRTASSPPVRSLPLRLEVPDPIASARPGFSRSWPSVEA